ncbi:TadE/TadG family type IV pilus assembly protein [Catellatospora vulcania]|uniref:TadE/TadG family type IV pilus assembly protein n=1 Tax=Catellatospora vulcania TaxID=1460450 RepID=UPI0012D3E190|nr:TadE family protein [Catellatospora vulcania]
MTRRDRGAAAVEMALMLPLLLLLVFGIIDFGRMLNTQIRITEAAREGARAVTITNSGSAASTRVAAVLGSTPRTVTITNPCGNAASTADARVRVDHTFAFITPISGLASLFGGTSLGTVQLSATGVMPCRS